MHTVITTLYPCLAKNSWCLSVGAIHMMVKRHHGQCNFITNDENGSQHLRQSLQHLHRNGLAGWLFFGSLCSLSALMQHLSCIMNFIHKVGNTCVIQ